LQSHHRAREGAFELNDVFAIINAVPAIALLNFGFFHKGLIPGLCFGAVSFSLLLDWQLATLAVKCWLPMTFFEVNNHNLLLLCVI
jgi:hypothetical protein